MFLLPVIEVMSCESLGIFVWKGKELDVSTEYNVVDVTDSFRNKLLDLTVDH